MAIMFSLQNKKKQMMISRGHTACISSRHMRRTLQCNGIRTVGTIVRRFIQFMWQKIFTEDCDNDSKATSKFWVSASDKQKRKKN